MNTLIWLYLMLWIGCLIAAVVGAVVTYRGWKNSRAMLHIKERNRKRGIIACICFALGPIPTLGFLLWPKKKKEEWEF